MQELLLSGGDALARLEHLTDRASSVAAQDRVGVLGKVYPNPGVKNGQVESLLQPASVGLMNPSRSLPIPTAPRPRSPAAAIASMCRRSSSRDSASLLVAPI